MHARNLEEQSLDLADYYRIIRRQWLIVAVAALLGILTAGVFTLVVSPTYTSRTQLFVSIQNSGSVQELAQGNSFGQSRVQSYVRTATTPTVLQPVIDSLGLDISSAELASYVSVTADLETVLINVDVVDESPVRAAAIAQGVAESLVQAVDTLERPSEADSSPVKLSVVTPATAPAQPSSPNAEINLILGLLLGTMAGFAAALLRSFLDTKVRGEADVRASTEAPIIGQVSFDNDAQRKPLLTQTPPQSPRAESFRQIRTNLQFSHVGRASKTVLFTSSLPGEGKSTTAINVAIALAQAGQSVALVDADLRRPSIASYLGLEGNVGLTSALVGNGKVRDLLQPWGEGNLQVLASGVIPPNPSELLGSEAMRTLIATLESEFDVLILDAPPLLPVTDAAVLAQNSASVVLVIGNQQVTKKELEKSLSALGLVKADLLGLVLNKVPTKRADAYSYAYEAKDPSEPTGSRRRGTDFSRPKQNVGSHFSMSKPLTSEVE